jgi:hypothetical protein
MFSIPAMVAMGFFSCVFQAYVELFGLVRGVLTAAGRKAATVRQKEAIVGVKSNNVLQ